MNRDVRTSRMSTEIVTPQGIKQSPASQALHSPTMSAHTLNDLVKWNRTGSSESCSSSSDDSTDDIEDFYRAENISYVEEIVSEEDEENEKLVDHKVTEQKVFSIRIHDQASAIKIPSLRDHIFGHHPQPDSPNP